MHVWLWRLILLVAFGVGGCGSDAPAPTTSRDCGDTPLFASQQRAARLERFTEGCVVNEDCGVISHRGSCPGRGTYSVGQEPYSLSQRDAVEAALVDDDAALCSAFPDCAVDFHLDTFVRYAFCEGGVCRGTDRGPDQVCPSLADALAFDAEIALGAPEDFLSCGSVDDCVLQTIEMRCTAGHHVVSCPVPMHKDAPTQILPSFLEQFDEERCGPRPFVCDFADDDCFVGTLQCNEDGRCSDGR